jgi:hypothetical protein
MSGDAYTMCVQCRGTFTDAELDESIPEYDEDEKPTGKMTTLRAYLNEMSSPGFLAGGGW